jgi:hypothetical protein
LIISSSGKHLNTPIFPLGSQIKKKGYTNAKQAKARFFLLLGLSYAAPRIPTAGGTAAALHNPKSPPKTSRYIALVLNPAIKLEMANAPMEKISRERRPNVSAIWAKRRRKAPEVKLIYDPLVQYPGGKN